MRILSPGEGQALIATLERQLDETVNACALVHAVAEGSCPAGEAHGRMAEIEHHLPGLGFFPGGDGLWKAPGCRERPPLPPGGIMVLGNTFQCMANHPERDSHGTG